MKVKVLFFSLVVGASAQADCRKVEVCDDYGYRCRVEQVCDSQFDLPATGLDPLPSIRQMELKPLPSIRLPPLGTSRCDYRLVNGQWQDVCR